MKKLIAKIVLVSMIGIGIMVGYSIHKANVKAIEDIPRVEKMKSPYADYKPTSTQLAPQKEPHTIAKCTNRRLHHE
jgi:hypothetical protein